jgi:hypothetical protein
MGRVPGPGITGITWEGPITAIITADDGCWILRILRPDIGRSHVWLVIDWLQKTGQRSPQRTAVKFYSRGHNSVPLAEALKVPAIPS